MRSAVIGFEGSLALGVSGRFWLVLVLVVGGYAGVLGFWVSGRGYCRVAAFGLSGLRVLDVFFITVSHCAWQRVISLSKATKKRSKENAFNRSTLSVHSVQFLFIGAPKARCSPEPRMCETLLLANPDTNTLRPVRSRASTSVPRTGTASHAFDAPFLGSLVEWPALKGPRGQLRHSQPDAYLLLQSLVSRLVGCGHFVGYGLILVALFSRWVGGVVRRAYKFGVWFSADSAGCSLGRFNHWWRSVWVSVFGEGGFHTSVALASTVLLGHL
jgi:hypothetical protein